MSSNAAKIIALVAVVLTLILAFLGWKVSREYAASAQQTQQQVTQENESPRILAVVAIKPLGAYKPIGRDDVVLGEVSVAPKNYYTSLEDVVGKQPLVDIDQGAPVTRRYFAEGNVLAKSIPPGFKAISVEVSDIIAVGGFVRPGDVVDVLMYLGRGGKEVDAIQARVLLKDLRVLAYQELIVDRPEGLVEDEATSDRSRSGRRQRTAVLAVPDKDVTRLMLGASMGDLRLALHGTITEDSELALLDAKDSEIVGLPQLPKSEEAKKAEAEKKVPDMAITAKELSRVEPPPAVKKKIVPRPKVIVYRGAAVETVRP